MRDPRSVCEADRENVGDQKCNAVKCNDGRFDDKRRTCSSAVLKEKWKMKLNKG